MKTIGIISPSRLHNIPKKFWAKHEFCFHLHDLMVALLQQMELQQAGHIEFKIETEEDKQLLESGIHIFDFLEQSGRGNLEKRLVINNVCIALYSDMLHFIFEAFRALEKRKFTVALSLLRKPLKEGIFIASQMCANEEAFFNKMKFDSKNLLNPREFDENSKKKIFETAMKVSGGCSFTTPNEVYDAVFNHQNEAGLAGLFDKATHLVTEFRRNQTENYNLNFIFKNPQDDDVYSGETYSQLATLLLYLHVLQIELYGRMREPSKKYQNWMLFTSIGSHEALFKKGQSKITNFVNSNFAEFMQCAVCGNQLRIKKIDVPKLLIAERLDCDKCLLDQHFPLGWLSSKFDINLFDD